MRFGPVAPLGRGHAGDRPAGGPFLHFAAALQALRWRVWGCREAPARTRSSPSMGLKGAVRVGAVRGLTVQRGAVLTRVAAD